MEFERPCLAWFLCEGGAVGSFVVRASLGYGGSRQNGPLLATMVGGHARRIGLGHMLHDFGGIFEKFPGLRVAFAHGGGSFPGGLGRIVRGYEARPDLVAVDNPVHPSEYLGKFWVDSLVHDPQMLRYLIEIVGSNRVALGSDYPFPLGEAKAGQLIRSMNLDKEHELDLLYRSALQWLDLGEEQVWSM